MSQLSFEPAVSSAASPLSSAVLSPVTPVILNDGLLSASRNIAFVDAGLASVDTLIAGLEDTQIVLIEGEQDGIAQITSALANAENLDAVHIFSHGSDGLLQLGNTLLSNANVEGYGESLQQWSAALSAEADLMIYGCNLAAGTEGLSLLSRLGELTGADVAASDDVTGVGGDWDLEIAVGEIESSVVLSEAVQASYEGELALLTNGDFESGLSGWRAFRGSESITSDAVSGSSALEIGGTSRGVRQTLSVTGGETYTLTGSGKTTSEGNTTIGITFYDGSGSRVAGKAQKIRSANWDEFAIEQEAPVGTASARVWAYKATDSGSFFLDNLALNSGVVEPPEPPASGTQLLANAGFESGLNQWKSYKGTETATSVGAFAGTKALKLSTAGSGARQIVDAVAGETYQVSGYAKSSSSGYMGFGVTFYDADGKKIQGSGVGQRVRSTEWQLYEGEAVAPADARFARFWSYKGTSDGDGLLDQLSLKTVGEPTVDPEPGVIGLATSTISAGEGDGTVRVTVNRSSGRDGAVTVDYRTVTGSASAGEDYEAIAGTLSFADGQTQQSVDITLLDDNSPEELETFGFAIDNVQGGATLLAPRTAQITIADDDGFTYNDNQYVVTTAKTWLQAQAEAEALGGNLVSINTAQEEAWLRQTFGNTESFWIGINDAETEGQFEWASGEQVAYTNWASGQPDDGGSGQDYGYLNFGSSRQWDDGGSGTNFRGIVEIGDYNGPVLGRGNGLKGEYYNNIDFTDLALERTDATVDFDWELGSPDPAIGQDTFSVRWTGKVEPLYSETYTFQTTSDDGVKLWVNDRLIINEFQDQGPTAYTGTITLAAGQQYDIRLEYYENGGGALSELAWSSASQAFEIVPRSQLYSDPVDSRTLDSETVIAGLTEPTAIDWLTDGSNKMFIAEKGGVVKVFENGNLRSTPFIDISDQVNGIRDRGLLDIAIHPNFDANPYVYLLYTYDPPEVFNFTGESGPDGTNNRAARLIRVTADASTNYRTAVAGSEVVLLGKNSTWDNFNGQVNSTFDFDEAPAGILPDGSNLQDFLNADSESHTVGSVEFGPDGALYVSNGDGASYNRVDPRASRVQDIDNLSGKILRINPINGKGLSDNPFYNGDADANRSKVYQLGLRNPFRITVDPDNGKVYTGDVGWTQWEEVNAGEAGSDFGWPYYEGGDGESRQTVGYSSLPEAQAFYNSGTAVTPSFLGLNHNTTGINAIVMGDVYTGDAYPDRYKGDLFFGDLGQGIVRNISLDGNGDVSSVDTFTTEDPYIVQMVQGPDDLLYYVNLVNGTVSRWVFD